MQSESIVLAVLLLAPVVGFLFNGLRFRSHNATLAGIVATGMVAISFVCGLILFNQLLGMEGPERVLRISYFSWLSLGNLDLPVAFVVDPLSILMVLIITGVGSLIHLFSVGYMSHDATPAKYFAYLNFFIFNMLLLVLGANLILMFVGWEGVGLCSYLLIGYWFTDKEKATAGMKAFITNRIGDAGFLLGIFTLFFTFNTIDFAQLISALPSTAEIGWTGPMTLACLFLFIGATGKSAQIPLYVWLPDAMAGPTPVSALIHAATMVTAGVYMIIRLNPLFLLSPNAMAVVAAVGAATALFAATMGLAQNDIKKVLAYSTVSQLGYMFLAVGVGAFTAGFFHLMTHAFFKALMFLGSGSVIHAMHEEQDMLKMGGLKKYLPITHATFVCGWLAIIGFPLFSGFFSKDEILWMSFHSPLGGKILWAVGAIAALFTAFYMTRLMAMTFWGKSRVPKDVHPHESPLAMTIPLMVLAVLSVFAGWVGVPHGLATILPGHPHNILEHWFEGVVHPIPNMEHGDISLEMTLMTVTTLLGLGTAALAYMLYVMKPAIVSNFVSTFRGLYQLVYNKYWVDEIYSAGILKPLVSFSRGLWSYADVGAIDKVTYLVTDFVRSAGDGLRAIQNGQIQSYALVLLIGVVASVLMLIM
ncbi:MAG: NADH-quinone oxidoreductase subunit L [Bdellovibrionaceae bacterium]|nr:NADH-quinone oxidoreductase subunit L [Pseudobdellovibrionaceae bacterium]